MFHYEGQVGQSGLGEEGNSGPLVIAFLWDDSDSKISIGVAQSIVETSLSSCEITRVDKSDVVVCLSLGFVLTID